MRRWKIGSVLYRMQCGVIVKKMRCQFGLFFGGRNLPISFSVRLYANFVLYFSFEKR